MTEADALRTLNTEILAGSGPDILRLDGMSTKSYLEKDVLLDLSDLLTETPDAREDHKMLCFRRKGLYPSGSFCNSGDLWPPVTWFPRSRTWILW